MENISFGDLKGKTLVSVVGDINDREMIFTTTEGEKYRLYHWQDCCEDVHIEDIVGDLDDLVGSEILLAEASSNIETGTRDRDDRDDRDDWDDSLYDSIEWTFYKLATLKGYVDIRWYGSSDGPYATDVSFDKVESSLD